MKKASGIFPASEKSQIEDTIREAESRTSAEIVLVLASRSGRYDRAEDLFGILLGLVAMSGVWVFGQDLQPAWGDEYRLAVGLIPLLVVFGVFFLFGAWLATRYPLLARPLIGRTEMYDEMRKAAAQSFFQFRVRQTADAVGMLIYVTLYERMVWVVGDDAIAREFSDRQWETVCDRIVRGFKEAKPAEGLREAITMAADHLEGKFPRREGDKDELPNEIRFVD